MKTRTSIWFVVLITSFNTHNCAYAQPSSDPYVFEHFDTSDGLLSNFANAVIQDSLGFIWFLNDNGLTRFDGYNFKPYPPDSVDNLRLSSNIREGMMFPDRTCNGLLVKQQSRDQKTSCLLLAMAGGRIPPGDINPMQRMHLLHPQG
jgi:ligand-binding sensor domain-containing protein